MKREALIDPACPAAELISLNNYISRLFLLTEAFFDCPEERFQSEENSKSANSIRMKILCIPGAFSNAKSLRAQLLPLIHALESDGTATFYITEGPKEMSPPPGYEDFFGEPPNKCFQTEETFAAITSLILSPTHSSLEDSIHHFKDYPGHGLIVEAIETLSHLLETEGPFDGVLGVSEGSGLAATLLADHMMKSRAAGKDSMIKLGIFWGGMPPFTVDGKRWYLPHTDGQIFDLPTIHVIGAMDPFLAAGMLLYNLCDPHTATLFDHGKGHQIVWDPKIVNCLVEVIREQIAAISCR